MSKWWLGAKEEDKVVDKDGKEDDIELKPGDVKAKLDQIDGLSASVKTLTDKSATLDRMAAYLDKQDKAERDSIELKRRETKAASDEDLETEFVTDPAAATRRLLDEKMNPMIMAQVNTAATLTMRDLFAEHPEEFEYATDPTIRREVEQQMQTLPLVSRSNPESIRNCYYVVEGRHKAEIKEGKIKSRLSAASGSTNGTGGPTTKTEETVVLSDAEKRAAAVFGMKPEEYAKSKKELSYV